jgi:cytochrome c-type biogenesis protein
MQLLGIFNFKIMNRDIRFFTANYNNNLAFPVLVGAAFGFGWTPCIGPILGSILALAAIEESLSKGILLLSFYSLGLAIPFIISGFLIDKFLVFSKSMKKYILWITKGGGFILLLTGIAILTNQLQVLGFFIFEYFPMLGKIG